MILLRRKRSNRTDNPQDSLRKPITNFRKYALRKEPGRIEILQAVQISDEDDFMFLGGPSALGDRVRNIAAVGRHH